MTGSTSEMWAEKSDSHAAGVHLTPQLSRKRWLWGFFVSGPRYMASEVSNLFPLTGESQTEHYRRVFPLTKGNTSERNAAVLDAWDSQGDEAGELDQAADKMFPPEKFTRVARVPVFAEHKTPRHNWDYAKLTELVEHMNHRVLDTGSFSPLTEGHTPDGEAVKHGAKQPQVLGYQGKFRLGLIGNKSPRWTVFADEYHHKAEVEKLSRMTRRSPEVWVSAARPFFDPCAALGAETPRLDMGTTISYSRAGYWTAPAGSDGAQVEKYSMADAAFPGSMNTSIPTDKSNYAGGGGDDQQGDIVGQVISGLMESDVFKAITALYPLIPALQELVLNSELPEEDDGSDDDKSMQDAQQAPGMGEPDGDEGAPAPGMPQMAAAPPAAPAPAAPSPPAPQAEPDADDSAMMSKYMAGQCGEVDLKTYRDGKKAAAASKPAQTAEHYQLKAEIEDLRRQREALAADVEAKRAGQAEAIRYSRLNSMRDQGYEFQLADELALTRDFTDAQFEAHCSKVVTRYSRLPVGQRSFPVIEGDALPESEVARYAAERQLQRKAENYALAEAEKGNDIDMRAALKYVREQESSTSASVK